MALSTSHAHHVARQRPFPRSSGFLLTLLFLLVCLLSRVTVAQDLPPNFSVEVVTGGFFGGPTVIAFAPDGRLFVAEQNGALRVVKTGTLLPAPFVQLTVDSRGERGLIGVTFDPDFTTNQYIYLYYTVPASASVPVHNRISRFTANGDVAVANSEFVVLDLDPLSGATNHNGGSMAFRPDGKLYIAVGDNADGGNAQNLNNHLGKVLRLNADGSTPAGNPFTTGTDARKRIWVYGLRNPYTLTVQPGTGRLFVNDVGQSTWEEINDASTSGLNFGWPHAEGASTNPAFTNPVYAYQHGNGDGVGCAITGGTFYNPTVSRYPSSFEGKYFFQDYCSNWINTLALTGPSTVRSSFATGLSGLNLSVSQGHDGYLYYISLSSGSLYRIVYAGQDCLTLQNGNWPDAATWSCGREPISADQATLRHAVTIGPNAVQSAKQLRYQSGGQLVFGTNSKLQLGL